MFALNERGQVEFVGGRSSWRTARAIAETCDHFKEDVEDEIVANDEVSCYNCRYRRWTEESFVCLKRT